MPCYNSSKYIKEAIDSIIGQTFTDFEFIIINDGSTDDTHEVISQYKDPRINYIYSKKNGGNYIARNEGLKISRGLFICTMDADDIAYPNRLAVQYDYMLKHPEIGCLGSNADLIDQYGNLTGEIKRPLLDGKRISTLFLMNNFIIHPSTMLRKEMLSAYGLYYNIKYKYSSDFDLLGRCSQHFSVTSISDKLLKYRLHGNQISDSKRKEQKEYADHIRLSRLREFRVRYSGEQKRLYLKLMDNEIALDQAEKEACLIFLEKLLVKNGTIKLYDQDSLYKFFSSLLNR